MKKIILMTGLLTLLLTSCDVLNTSSGSLYQIYTDDLDYTNDSLKANGPYTSKAMPSAGDVNVLVVPVNFNSSKKKNGYLEAINNAFNGETNSYSVSEYYKKSSYGKLNLSFDVLDWYTPKNTASYYSSYEDDYDDGSTVLYREILDYLDSSIDFKDYDSDNDGYIDALWMVYNYDTYQTSDFWWAFSFLNQTNDEWDGVKAANYAFAGVDFLGDYLSYNSGLEKVDAKTFIHETGHLMGLDDYYSYNDSYSPLYGMDMMDQNVGDHSSISKILLGWVTPTVITATTKSIDLEPFTEKGKVLLISDHKVTTIYDEYILIDFYNGLGLDEYDNIYRYGLTRTIGIRVYHVDATINTNEKNEIIYNGGDYSSPFKYDNTDSDNKFVRLLRQDTEKTNSYSGVSGDYLYRLTGKSFGKDIYKNYILHSGKALAFSMTVNSLTDTLANVSIDFK